jgi:hypothetical protein
LLLVNSTTEMSFTWVMVIGDAVSGMVDRFRKTGKTSQRAARRCSYRQTAQ